MPLHVTTGARQIEIIDIPLKTKAKPCLQDGMGDTALHKAIYGSYNGFRKAIIEKLLQVGAPVLKLQTYLLSVPPLSYYPTK